eukprot:CAMPEP_0113562004 /NCGR_PEP_ID=MMETSP0015_2-20120614/20289_1 /TAXON_ID=2838 /ORGANISM="Odontella" /LENGTH=95 /DNA_ID=CAMNT_0000463859 /DNA_START=163 /DNA_END=446 /DNA_ORIENTATION=+ /assembly_acc=CAM_ASM_000160
MSTGDDSTGSDDEFQVDASAGSRYPVHDCCEFEDAESLRSLIFVRQEPSDGGPSDSSSSQSSSDDDSSDDDSSSGDDDSSSSSSSSDENDSHAAA